MDFPGGTVLKNQPASAADTGDMGLIPGSGRSPGVGDGKNFSISCLEKPMDRGAWKAQFRGSQRVRHDLAHTGLSSSVPGKLNRVYLLLIDTA